MAAATSNKGISKMEAVRRALKELGKDAMPVKIQEFVKEHFNMEMSTAHISNYKTFTLRSKKGRKTARKMASKAAAAEVSAPAKSGNGIKVSLEDIETVKGLVGRVGEKNLKNLIGLLG